jgi:uncharacterized protein DUF3352
MNNEGDLTPPPADPVASTPAIPPAAAPVPGWWARYRRFLIPAAALAIAGTAAAAALVLALRPTPSIEKMVPASADVIAVANLDPSVAQKVNLMRAVHSFPDYKTDKAITDKLDEAFKDSGFTFTGDVQPWLGSEIGFSARIQLVNTETSPAAFYAVSRDDAKARAMLAKLRASTWGKKYQWKDETYNGFTISSGTPTVTSEKANAYSYVDHVVVIATSSALIREIIDTEQGRAPRLVDSSDYKATIAGLPSDRLGLVYVNGKSLVRDVRKDMATTPAMSLALRNVNDIDALQGIGATLSANGDGLVADLLVKLDQSKLAPATRQALAQAGRTDTVVRWIPRASDAFLAISNLNQTIQTLLDQAGSGASTKASTDTIGLTGPGGVLPHLTGDAGLEVDWGRNGLPAGAILLGTNDSKSMNAFFGRLLVLAEGAAGSGFSGSGAGSSFGSSGGATSPLAGRVTTSTYRGVVITSWTSPMLGQASLFTPSYAVLDGMGILASTPSEVKAIIDTHKDGATIASDPTYKTASAASLATSSAIIYVDVAKLLTAIRESPFGSQAGLGADSTLSANLGPIRAVMLTAASQADKAVERLFVIIR